MPGPELGNASYICCESAGSQSRAQLYSRMGQIEAVKAEGTLLVIGRWQDCGCGIIIIILESK